MKVNYFLLAKQTIPVNNESHCACLTKNITQFSENLISHAKYICRFVAVKVGTPNNSLTL